MSVESISIADLDELSEDVADAMEKVTDARVKERLKEIGKRIGDMKVARIEIEHVNDEFHHGNFTQEFYSMKHKQLLADFIHARDAISNDTIQKISDLAPDDRSKRTLSGFAVAIKTNKGFVLGVSQLIVSIVSIFGRVMLH